MRLETSIASLQATSTHQGWLTNQSCENLDKILK
jgi:hypothetical protein